MSRAFVKEPEGGEAFDDLPERPISPHQNFVTADGLARIDAEIAQLQRDHEETKPDDRPSLARIARDLRYWRARRGSAQLVPRPVDGEKVQFGSTVTVRRSDGRIRPSASLARTRRTPRAASFPMSRRSPGRLSASASTTW